MARYGTVGGGVGPSGLEGTGASFGVVPPNWARVMDVGLGFMPMGGNAQPHQPLFPVGGHGVVSSMSSMQPDQHSLPPFPVGIHSTVPPGPGIPGGVMDVMQPPYD